MKQFLDKSVNKSGQNFVPQGAVIVDSGVGGTALIAQLHTLPMQLIYLNVAMPSQPQPNLDYLKTALCQIPNLHQYVVVLPSNSHKLYSCVRDCNAQVKIVACEPPLYQARQYSTTQVAVLSSTGAIYPDCQSIDCTKLANMIQTDAPNKQIRSEIEACLANVYQCDAVAFDDCIFSAQKHNFWLCCPNVKFFDCVDGMASMFFKNKKLRQNNQSPSLVTNFCDQTGKIEEIFNKILQKIYKPY